jgi:hypothetical protein
MNGKLCFLFVSGGSHAASKAEGWGFKTTFQKSCIKTENFDATEKLGISLWWLLITYAIMLDLVGNSNKYDTIFRLDV